MKSMDIGYDMITAMYLLRRLGIDILNSTDSIKWDSAEIPQRPRDSAIQRAYYIEDSPLVPSATKRLAEMLDAKNQKSNLKDIAEWALKLDKNQQKKFGLGFDGTLGQWKGNLYNIHLKEDAIPYYGKPYKITQIYESRLKVEVEVLCEIGLLKKINQSQRAAPCFIIPKKDTTNRFWPDFRELNKRIKRYLFPIPNIQDLLMELEGFQRATSLGLNMGYYHIELSADSKKICIVVLPWGKYEYQKLPMGICNSPDVFQEVMPNLFRDLEFAR